MDDTPLKESISSKDIINDFEENNSSKNKYHKKIIISSIIVFGLLAITIIVLIFTVFNKNSKKTRSLLEKLKKYKTPYYYYNTSLLNETVDELISLSKEYDLKIHFSLKSNFKTVFQEGRSISLLNIFQKIK